MLAQWNMSVMMPPKGAEVRGTALAKLNVHVHGLLSDTQVDAWLAAAETSAAKLSVMQRANPARNVAMLAQRECAVGRLRAAQRHG